MSQKAGISNTDWMSFAKQRNYSNPKMQKPKHAAISERPIGKPKYSSPTPKKIENREPLRYEVTPPRLPVQ